MKKLMMVVTIALLVGCTSNNEATRVLRQGGYKDIEYTGYSFFACSRDDAFHTGFRATSPSGEKVEGVVCSGLLKGATIRIE